MTQIDLRVETFNANLKNYFTVGIFLELANCLRDFSGDRYLLKNKPMQLARHLLISNYFLGISSASVRTWRSSNHSVMCPKSWHSNCAAASWRPEPFPKLCTRARRCWQRYSRSLPGISVSRPWPRWPHVQRVRVCQPSDPAVITAVTSWRDAWLTTLSWQIAGTNI